MGLGWITGWGVRGVNDCSKRKAWRLCRGDNRTKNFPCPNFHPSVPIPIPICPKTLHNRSFLKKTKTSVTLSLWDPLLRTERKSMKSPNVIPPADTLMLHHKPALSVSSSWWDPIFLSSNTSTYDEGKKAEIPIQTSGNLCCLYQWIWRQGAHIWPTLQAGRETDKPGRETQINIRLFFLINLVSQVVYRIHGSEPLWTLPRLWFLSGSPPWMPCTSLSPADVNLKRFTKLVDLKQINGIL